LQLPPRRRRRKSATTAAEAAAAAAAPETVAKRRLEPSHRDRGGVTGWRGSAGSGGVGMRLSRKPKTSSEFSR